MVYTLEPCPRDALNGQIPGLEMTGNMTNLGYLHHFGTPFLDHSGSLDARTLDPPQSGGGSVEGQSLYFGDLRSSHSVSMGSPSREYAISGVSNTLKPWI